MISSNHSPHTSIDLTPAAKTKSIGPKCIHNISLKFNLHTYHMFGHVPPPQWGNLVNILNLIPFPPYNANLSPHISTPEHRWNPWIPLLVRQQVPNLYPLWSLCRIQLLLLQMIMWISTLKGSLPSLRAVPLLPTPWSRSRRNEWVAGCCRRQPMLPVKFLGLPEAIPGLYPALTWANSYPNRA